MSTQAKELMRALDIESVLCLIDRTPLGRVEEVRFRHNRFCHSASGTLGHKAAVLQRHACCDNSSMTLSASVWVVDKPAPGGLHQACTRGSCLFSSHMLEVCTQVFDR